MDLHLKRREFLKVMGGAGVATLAGCSGEAPTKLLLSPPTPHENVVPGLPTWYASVCRECPAGCGIVVATRQGRPIKIEGNPLHPVNRGALCARGQAALQGLYNPNRVEAPAKRLADGSLGSVSWDDALEALSAKLRDLQGAGSPSRAALVTPFLSGAMARLVDAWAEEIPGLSVYENEPVSYEPLREANSICFGRRALSDYRLDRADLVVSFGADFLETWVAPVSYASAFAGFRTYREGRIGEFIYVGSRHGLTAANADQAVLIRPGTHGALALGIIRLILQKRLRPVPPSADLPALRRLVDPYDPGTVHGITDVPADTVRQLARVIAYSPRSIALPGGVEQSGTNATRNAVAVNLLNHVLGAFDDRIELREGRVARTTPADFGGLVDRMREGAIDFVLFLGVNPAYSTPPSSGFVDALQRVGTVACCSDVHDETTAVSDYVLPVHHALESWGDFAPGAGVHGLMQPALRPLADSRHAGDVLIQLATRTGADSSALSAFPTFHDFLVDAWKELAGRVEPGSPFAEFWDAALRRGGLFRAMQPPAVKMSRKALQIGFEAPQLDAPGAAGAGAPPGGAAGEELTLVVYPSLLHYDGRGANRPWLQEVPDPMLQTTWGSYLEVPRPTALRLGLQAGDVVRIRSSHGLSECPVVIADHAYPGAVALALGQGHRRYGQTADGTGVNPFELLAQSFDGMSGGFAYLGARVRLEKTGRRERIPSPQGHPYDEGRGVAEIVPLSALRGGAAEPHEPAHERHDFKDLLTPHEHPDHRWGMVIDLNACIGCSACEVACYAENNVSVVGREQFLMGREMGWIRVERFLDRDRPGEAQFVPMLCQQCDNAPCEPVCPVYATYHTPEGLNAQVYNRCVGTRYCANNCPYSVRRFNWYTFPFPEPLNQQLNPNVTVRTKGVMEKCTFCIQRIVAARDRAKDEERKVKDGEIEPACAQTCPTKAITFGDLQDPHSKASERARSSRGYRIFEHLNTKPAITYLKKISGRDDIV